MRVKNLCLFAVFLGISMPVFSATSRTYEALCKAWQPDGRQVFSGRCNVSVGIAGMSETLAYFVQIGPVEINIRLTGDRCELDGKTCIFNVFQRRNILRFTNEDRSILEFTAPPPGGF